MHVVLDSNGYMKGLSSHPIRLDDIGSIDLPPPDAFDEAWMCCYRRIGDVWMFDKEKKTKIMEAESKPVIAEMAMLKAQVQALTERGEFLEDLIAELAMMLL